MHYRKLCDVCLIVAVLIVMRVLEKKQPGQFKRVMGQSFAVALVCAAPLAFIETLAVFGIRLLNVDWAFTPLDFMAFLTGMFLLVRLGGAAKVLLPNWTEETSNNKG